MTLPPPQDPDGPYRIAMVCLGNICRSPMAQVIMAAKIGESGLVDRVVVDSSGTGDWHVGGTMDDRAAETLTGAGYDATLHRAQQFDRSWFALYDLVVAMDNGNLANIRAMARSGDDRSRIRLLREFDADAQGDLEVPDPYYGGQRGFDNVLAMVERSTDELLRQLEDTLIRT